MYDPHLLAEMAHALQTPLAVLKARIERLRGSMVREGAASSDLAGIDESIDALSRAIAFMLEPAARGGIGSSERRRERFSLSTLVVGAAEEAAVIAETRGIRLDAGIASGIEMVGDARDLRETAMNLLGNAVKYMGDGPIRTIRVTLSADRSEGTPAEAVLTVADTGLGIPADDLPHIFDRFYRSRQIYGIAPGAGLGLALAKRTARAHGGSIGVESAVGRGTTFTVRLPLPPSP